MSQSEYRVLWSSKVKLCSFDSTPKTTASGIQSIPKNFNVKLAKIEPDNGDKHERSNERSAKDMETKRHNDNQIVNMLPKSSQLSAEPPTCKVNILEFGRKRCTKMNMNISALSEYTQAHKLTPEKFLNDDINPEKPELSSVRLVEKKAVEQGDESKDTDSEMEVNEFLDNDEKITIPKYNDLLSKNPCRKFAKNITETEAHNFPTTIVINGIPKDESDSANTNDNEEITNARQDIDAFDELKKFMNYICPQCGKSCENIQKWKQHTNTEHKLNDLAKLNMEITPNSDGKSLYKCRNCNLECTKKYDYSHTLNHYISHLPYRKYFVCKICSSGFSTKYALIKHIQLAHAKQLKNYDAQLKSKDSVYSEYVKIRCPLCFEYQIDSRQNHLHLEHKHDYFNQAKTVISIDETPMTCRLCNVKVKRQSKPGIIMHMLTHELHKTFICEFCNNFESTVRCDVVKHIKEEHFHQITKRYKCAHCKVTFSKKRNRDLHCQRKHSL